MSVFFKKRKDGIITAWYFNFMYNNVRYRGVGGTTKTQALGALDKKRSEDLSGEIGLTAKVGNPRMEKFSETYLMRRQHLRSHKRDDLSVRTLSFSRARFSCQSSRRTQRTISVSAEMMALQMPQ